VRASQTGERIDVYERLGRSLDTWQEPGATELCDLVHRMLHGAVSCTQTLDLERLKPGVFRLRIGDGPMRAVMLKCLKPAVAQTDRLVAERWLPALRLGDCAPRLLAGAGERDGCWVWHAYEDLGDEALDRRREPPRLEAAITLIAELHTRGANHPLIPEVRWRARDHGAHFFTANLRDAIAAFEALAMVPRDVPPEFTRARARLLERLYELLEDAPRRVRALEEAGGPDTLLHGDLWPQNVFVTENGNGRRAQLIDWDRVGAGPFSYDLSTFLYRSSPEERPWILQQYREAVQRAGWRLPEIEELNLQLHTAESSRYVHYLLFAAMALLHDEAEWAIDAIIDGDRWFEALRPPLQD
jgi:Phosphotransferase enzyme family